jgi:hypothetical protein
MGYVKEDDPILSAYRVNTLGLALIGKYGSPSAAHGEYQRVFSYYEYNKVWKRAPARDLLQIPRELTSKITKMENNFYNAERIAQYLADGTIDKIDKDGDYIG